MIINNKDYVVIFINIEDEIVDMFYWEEFLIVFMVIYFFYFVK